MKNYLILLSLALALAACAKKPEVDITHSKVAVAPAKPIAKPRSEPIFYNGKTYQLNLGPTATPGLFAMAVGGMSAKQQKDAVAVATSSLGYYACPEGQRGKLTTTPAYVDTKWTMQAKCG
jgi:hypothetical protein